MDSGERTSSSSGELHRAKGTDLYVVTRASKVVSTPHKSVKADLKDAKADLKLCEANVGTLETALETQNKAVKALKDAADKQAADAGHEWKPLNSPDIHKLPDSASAKN